jgi:hypothetical protein
MTTTAPPQHIFIIRHAEKPADDDTNNEPPFGIDINGNPNPHSLIPRGWQRSGALADLFDPAIGPIRSGIAVPDRLYSPGDAHPKKTLARRATETIQALSDRSTVPIMTGFGVNDEQSLAEAVLVDSAQTVLICWEHNRIPLIAAAIPTKDPTAIPTTWPDDRFDIIWCFTLDAVDRPRYAFSQIPQQLLPGDTNHPIPATSPSATRVANADAGIAP